MILSGAGNLYGRQVDDEEIFEGIAKCFRWKWEVIKRRIKELQGVDTKIV